MEIRECGGIGEGDVRLEIPSDNVTEPSAGIPMSMVASPPRLGR
jgi:hypothetical protein